MSFQMEIKVGLLDELFSTLVAAELVLLVFRRVLTLVGAQHLERFKATLTHRAAEGALSHMHCGNVRLNMEGKKELD
jgi:hypothetical protein